MYVFILLIIFIFILYIRCNNIKHNGGKLIYSNINYKNIKINFEIKNYFKIEKKKLLISCCFFINKNKSKKDIDNKYIKGLLELYKWSHKNNHILRIYYDNSAIQIINKHFIGKKDIQLFKYHCELFYNKTVHYNTFGTLIRFLPLFDIKEHYHNYTYILDIDNVSSKESLYNKMIFMSNLINKNTIYYSSKFGYSNRSQFKNMNIKYPMLAGIFINRNLKFNKDNILSFIYEHYVHNKNLNTLFIYGIDEIYLNKNFTTDNYYCFILKDKITHSVYKDYYNILKNQSNEIDNIIKSYNNVNINHTNLDIIDEINQKILNILDISNKVNKEKLIIYIDIYIKRILFDIVLYYKNKIICTNTNKSNIRFNFDIYYNKSLNYKLQQNIKVYNYTDENFIKYIKNVECCKFTNYTKHIVDFNKIKEKLGNLKISVKKGEYNSNTYGNFSKTFWKDNSYKTTIKEFIDNIINKDIDIKNIPYAGNILIGKKNIKKLFGETFKFPFYSKIRQPKFWLSKKNTITKLHRDTADNLIIQIYGIKKWTIYPLNLQDFLYYTNTLPIQHYSSQRSLVDITNPDLVKYPLFKHIQNYKLEIMMYPGDLLFLPLGFAHEVETISDSIMFNYWVKDPKTIYNI